MTSNDIEQRLREDVARAWASIDGKVEQFDLEKNNPNLAYDDPLYVGSYEGYLAEADELLKRSGVGTLVASLRSKLEEAEGARDRLMRAAYLAGFQTSSEGYNAEYPFEGEDIEDDKRWREGRELALASLRDADHAA